MKWIIALLMLTLSGCTIIRYVDPNENNNGGTTPPREVDMLVLVDLSRSSANLSSEYARILGALMGGLELQNIDVRKTALAPLERRAGETVPLIYGTGDDESEFRNFAEAIAFFARDGGDLYLTDPASSDGENLALLGMQLDERAIYRPNVADPSGRPYFTEPADGFVVVVLSASPRLCDVGSEGCDLNGMHPGDFFAGNGWVEFPGGGTLPSNKIFHLYIGTQEGHSDFEAFYDHCKKQPNFPMALIDVLQPSSGRYFGPVAQRLNSKSGEAMSLDLCEVMSMSGEFELGKAVAKIRLML